MKNDYIVRPSQKWEGLFSGMGLLANGVADAETIDKDWKLTMCAPIGPFEELDYIGVPAAYHVVKKQSSKR